MADAKQSGRDVPKMTILGSRDQYCIHPHVSNKNNKNDECKRLLTSHACKFYKNTDNLKKSVELQPGGSTEIFDIEDLIALAHQKEGCPYFASKLLSQEAELIFCPYNYIIEPILRRRFDIDLRGAIIIIDEAHNIEDCCKEAACYNCDFPDFNNAREEISLIYQIEAMKEDYHWLHTLIDTLWKWAHTSVQSFNEPWKSWDGSELLGILGRSKIDETVIDKIAKSFRRMSDLTSDGPKLGTSTVKTIEGLLTTLTYFFAENKNFVKDFSLVITKETKTESQAQKFMNASLNIWCNNPGVNFREISKDAHSVILTSGTLSPMVSFASELKSTFPVQLEAPHVIPADQIWATVHEHGPSGKTLLGSYTNADDNYFDEIGESIALYCAAIPNGILCFFPSYKVMETAESRWNSSGILRRISQTKTPFFEERGKNNFDRVMEGYYDAVRSSRVKGSQNKGGILFAICRGKVSEGIDFRDENARAVIIVGIPFPNIKDPQMLMKRNYNSFMSKKDATIMDGKVWYELQAWRAINQAVGRTIRHVGDYGAIILLDSRFSQSVVSKYLSKWIRNLIGRSSDFETSISRASHFFETMAAKFPPKFLTQSEVEKLKLNSPSKKSKIPETKKRGKPIATTGNLHSFFRAATAEDEFNLKVEEDPKTWPTSFNLKNSSTIPNSPPAKIQKKFPTPEAESRYKLTVSTPISQVPTGSDNSPPAKTISGNISPVSQIPMPRPISPIDFPSPVPMVPATPMFSQTPMMSSQVPTTSPYTSPIKSNPVYSQIKGFDPSIRVTTPNQKTSTYFSQSSQSSQTRSSQSSQRPITPSPTSQLSQISQNSSPLVSLDMAPTSTPFSTSTSTSQSSQASTRISPFKSPSQKNANELRFVSSKLPDLI
eukprot:TRINITY_DN4215_c0_g1_i2.p1 TRINITY_DN4215_c0_g1~~TRINITY_DN4215_c0_g1_i2.p1  ORF type:complete len:1028 (-),score=324.22 TRINITY_DN4215_c0_g1_i2:562-3225(-)